jgi:hypothetical protein
MVLKMNPLIKKLAEKSGFFPVPDETEVDWEYRAENVRYEKFAELIVKECLNKCIHVENECRENKEHKAESSAVLIKLLIKEHFGIEE